MEHQTLFDGSPGARCPLSVATRRSEIGLSRHRVDGAARTLAKAPPQDADLVILQLRDQPPHDFWADGLHVPMPFSPAGALRILDLRRESAALFENPVDSLHLYLPRTALDDLAEAAGAPKIAGLTTERDWENSDKTMRCLQPLLLDMLHASGTLASSFKEHVVLAAATHVAATYGGMRREPVRHGGLAPWQARRAKEMLEANLTKEVSLLDIAESCGLSLSHFSRAFKASTGHTPHSWLQRCRVERARELLRSPTIPFAEIAIACGFADQSHFTRTFKRATGSTPGHWRRISLC